MQSVAKMPNDGNFSRLVAVAAVSFVVFQAFCRVVKSIIPLPSAVSLSKGWLYYNTLISFIHALISSVWSIYCFHDNPGMLSNLMKNWSLTSAYLLAFLAGYMLHDTLDIITFDFKGSLGLIIHHIVVISITMLVLYTEQCLPLATCLCVIEINSVFLHSRRLMHFHGGNRSHFKYKLNLVALFATFVALRFVFVVLLTAYFIHNRHMAPLNIYVPGVFGFIALIVINLILFFRLCKIEFMEKASRNKEHINGIVKEKFN